MEKRDLVKLAEKLTAVSGMYGRALSADTLGVYCAALSGYSLPAIEAAIAAHLRDPDAGRFMPTAAHLIAQLRAATPHDGRPSADEAWAIAVQGADEAATVVWTQEIAEAWGTVISLHARDQVGARMAFRATYDRIVEAAREAGRPVEWQASFGHDPSRRVEAINNAVSRGLLPGPQAAALLPAPEDGHGEANREFATRMLAEIRSKFERPVDAAAVERDRQAAQRRLAALKGQADEL